MASSRHQLIKANPGQMLGMCLKAVTGAPGKYQAHLVPGVGWHSSPPGPTAPAHFSGPDQRMQMCALIHPTVSRFGSVLLSTHRRSFLI